MTIETIFDNWKDSPGDLTFETLITILTIENLNSVNHFYLTINCDTEQHSQFLRCFYLFMRFMRFEIFIRIKRLICMKGILTLTHGQH